MSQTTALPVGKTVRQDGQHSGCAQWTRGAFTNPPFRIGIRHRSQVPCNDWPTKSTAISTTARLSSLGPSRLKQGRQPKSDQQQFGKTGLKSPPRTRSENRTREQSQTEPRTPPPQPDPTVDHKSEANECNRPSAFWPRASTDPHDKEHITHG